MNLSLFLILLAATLHLVGIDQTRRGDAIKGPLEVDHYRIATALHTVAMGLLLLAIWCAGR